MCQGSPSKVGEGIHLGTGYIASYIPRYVPRHVPSYVLWEYGRTSVESSILTSG